MKHKPRKGRQNNEETDEEERKEGLLKMGRPKGSKNKKDAAEVKPNGDVHVAAEKPKEAATKWEPEPDMKRIEPKKMCECGHDPEHHFGSADKWCNKSGCNCQKLRI